MKLFLQIVIFFTLNIQASNCLSCCGEGRKVAQSRSLYGKSNCLSSKQKRPNFCQSVSRICCLKEEEDLVCNEGEKYASPIFSLGCDQTSRKYGIHTGSFYKCCECCQLGKLAAKEQNSTECQNSTLASIICQDIYQRCCKSALRDLSKPKTCKELQCSHTCEISISGPQCFCNTGYRLNNDSVTCDDIDECQSKSQRCLASYKCINTPGSFHCKKNYNKLKCPVGYAQYDSYCRDIDECLTVQCPNTTACENTLGSYQCVKKLEKVCQKGYFRSMGKCVDKNECKTSNPCKRKEHCVNLVGSYKCDTTFIGRNCPSGYLFDGKSCKDINECNSNSHGCTRLGETCMNTLGSFRCTCARGYARDSFSGICKDIDECKSYRSFCGQNCINTIGSFRCECSSGFSLHKNKRTCSDINECSAGLNSCNDTQKCYNGRGGYVCLKGCPFGYRRGRRGRICYLNACGSGQQCSEKPIFIKEAIMSRSRKARFYLKYGINARSIKGVKSVSFAIKNGNDDGFIKIQQIGFSSILISSVDATLAFRKPFRRTVVISGKITRKIPKISSFEYHLHLFFY